MAIMIIRILTSVINNGLTSLPADPPPISNYIIAATQNGSLSNLANKIARTEDGGMNWTFITPDQDSVAWVESKEHFYTFQGNSWEAKHREVDVTAANIPMHVIHDVSLPEQAKLYFVGDGKVLIDALMTLKLYRPENIRAEDSQKIKTGEGTLGFTRPGRIPVPWYGVEPATTSEQNANLKEACQALQDAGGGHLYFPPGTYRFFNKGELDTWIFEFYDLAGITITGYNVVLELDRARDWQELESSSNFFAFNNCHHIFIDGFEGTGPDIIPDGDYPYGVAFSRFENGCSKIRIPYLKLQGWQAAVIAARPDDAPEQAISRGFTLGEIAVHGCTYGVNFQLSGHDSTIELLRTENVYRSFFIYGTENIQANIISHNPKGIDVNMSAISKKEANFPLRNIKVKYTNCDSNDSGNLMAVWLYFWGCGSPGIIEDIDLDISITYGDSVQKSMGSALWISKIDDCGKTDLGEDARGHIFRNVQIKAYTDGEVSNEAGQGGSVIRTQNGCNWVGETWSNVIFKDITVVKNTGDLSIAIDPRANRGELTFRNVVLPGTLNLWGSSSSSPYAPAAGKVIIDSVECSNLDVYTAHTLPVRVIEYLTGPTTLAIGWQGLTISNKGAKADIGYHLPAATAGLEYSFIRTTSDYSILIYPMDDENIHWANNGQYLSLDSQDSFVTLRCNTIGSWKVIHKTGLFSFEQDH